MGVRQQCLLFRKDMLLMRKNICWTLCELIIPIAISLLTLALLLFLGSHGLLEGREVFYKPESFPVKEQFLSNFEFNTKVVNCERWNPNDTTLVWTHNNDSAEQVVIANKIMQRLKNDLGFKLQQVPYSKKSVVDTLRNSTACEKFAGLKLDETTPTKLAYRLFLSEASSKMKWNIDKDFEGRFYEESPKISVHLFRVVPLQFTIDTAYIEAITPGNITAEDYLLETIPPATKTKWNVPNLFEGSLYFYLTFVTYMLVINTVRTISWERCEIKGFLQVMGLSRFTFYTSHILFGFLKFFIVSFFVILPVLYVKQHLNGFLVFTLIVEYCLASVCFSVLIATMFKDSNSAIKAALVLWLIIALLGSALEINFTDVWQCVLLSFNMTGAMYIASKLMANFLEREIDLNFSTLFETFDGTQFCLGYVMIFLLIDIIWMWSLAMLLDWLFDEAGLLGGVMDTIKLKVQNICRRKKEEEEQNEPMPVVAEYFEHDAEQEQAVKNLELKNLVKVWGTGKKAVKGVTLDMAEGQITALLGHNGAGKSTTFSMISGLTKPTSGEVFVCGKSMETDRNFCKSQVGYCPQGNCLYKDLTVLDHLWLIHGLKGAQTDWRQDAQDIITKLQFAEKADVASKKLSGGQKRKLCVCMALIGDSKVILLDEPTAGMDIEARHEVQVLLDKIKLNRTILLTTHYMDEAEALGERVAIMIDGVIATAGSPDFLKKTFGIGFELTFVLQERVSEKSMKEQEENNKKILEIVQKKSSEATSIQRGNQIIIHVASLENKFSDIFEELENESKNLGIVSFGVSQNSLEQVFIRVGEKMSNYGKNGENENEYHENTVNLVKSQNEERHGGCGLIFAQLIAIFWKRCLYLTKNWPQLLQQVVIPIAILLTWMISDELEKTTTFVTPITTLGERSLSYHTFPVPAIALYVPTKSDKLMKQFELLMREQSNVELIKYDGTDEKMGKISNVRRRIPPLPTFGLRRDPKGNYRADFSPYYYHSSPAIVNAISHAQLRALNHSKGTISIDLELVKTKEHDDALQTADLNLTNSFTNGIVLSMLLVLLFSMFTSAFVIFNVDERITKFRHQQYLSGISPVLFWAGAMLLDFVFYLVVTSIMLGIVIYTASLADFIAYFIVLDVAFFLATMPLIYAVSFMFSSTTKANILLIIWQVIIGFVTLFFMMSIRVRTPQGCFQLADKIEVVLLFFIPSYAFAHAISIIVDLDAPFLSFALCNFGGKLIKDEEDFWRCIWCMLFFSLVSSTIFLLLQFKCIRRIWFKCCSKSRAEYSSDPLESEAEKEMHAVAEIIEKEGRSETHLLLVYNISKYYNKVCAVKHLSMSVKRRECFGLLGRSGSGKTSVFDILTGQRFADTGKVTIDGKNVTANISLGYCPQFDAFMMEYTGRQILWLMSKLYGFKDPSAKAALVLKSMGLSGHEDKRVKFYSGGQKRKLSVGVSMLAPTTIVILDEPTAGIDPMARRDVWTVLTALREQSDSSLLLSSHSMDEVEALCGRIGILKEGRLMAIGSAQQLKTKYGKYFSLSMLAKDKEHRSAMVKAVKALGEDTKLATPLDSPSLRLKWTLAKKPTHRWSVLWKKLENLAEETEAVEFSISQPSLEEVFLNTATNNPVKSGEVASAEPNGSADTKKSAEGKNPSDTKTSAESKNPSDTKKSAEGKNPSNTQKSSEGKQSTKGKGSSEVNKSNEKPKSAEAVKKSNSGGSKSKE